LRRHKGAGIRSRLRHGTIMAARGRASKGPTAPSHKDATNAGPKLVTSAPRQNQFLIVTQPNR